MATQPHTEQPTTRTTEQRERKMSPFEYRTRVVIALGDIDSLFTAALCVLRLKDEYGDMSEENKTNALETLMEYGRAAVADATAGFDDVWDGTRE